MEKVDRALYVSAPGKVLLTGGYLVLDEAYSGLVLATTARFHTHIQAPTTGVPRQNMHVTIQSPQFDQTIKGELTFDERITWQRTPDSPSNLYIEETLVCAMNGIWGIANERKQQLWKQKQMTNLEIKLQADNDFYSQVHRLQEAHLCLCRKHLRDLPPFLPPHFEINEITGERIAAKTGMGSSAALVTSLVGALVTFFLPEMQLEQDQEDLWIVHHLAQLCHCFVQRKIGSGFDVSAACFGSQSYRRFPASLLQSLTNGIESLHPTAIASCILNHSDWNCQERVKPFRLPSGLQLMMGDVVTGSSTVSMVRKVLEWQRTRPEEATKLIQELDKYNQHVAGAFTKLFELYGAPDGAVVHATRRMLANEPAEKWLDHDRSEQSKLLLSIRSSFLQVRRCLREMGVHGSVPIEPPSQTALVDATMALPGVLIAGVPGAGGYDAVFVIALDESVLERIECFWQTYAQEHQTIICPLLCGAAPPKDAGLHVQRT